MSHGSGHSTAQTNDIGPLQNSTKSTQTTTTTTKTQSQNFGVQKSKRQYLSKKKKEETDKKDT